ncbi:Substrate-specific component RibU of riboflavin ECF transporter [Pediococcus damnosus]|uniref:Riboflavin transporter n=1 Tax=Pediococcus damnosus TaxID=51663 RepID=A0A0R2GXE3_9LACO|nr:MULTISPECIES: ECF transporter S component [Pediococcus]AMV60268.1 Substrate-specific component RibU of riboflavin ECF transporter [Pediococcus damnosus]AMV62793.1 Substrate-specific component RibU of riboflavin ECF transporter [Pediococcus damnosus]AMV64518.1 Substrate-specific component RibU of riboflavin ECF transporter [Pediococcus damnosus]AMV67321.1 Substrate-specific component RibU of riboflavin ECF transporter [Pediococcus damnosus]AMV69626.1 Substrate-specific component RibU of ribo
MGSKNVTRLVVIAMMAAISYILLLFGFPILPGFSFLKIDFANVPILIIMLMYGPGAGIATTAVAGLLDIVTKDSSMVGIIGIIANFLATMCFALPIYYAVRKHVTEGIRKQIKYVIRGIIVGTISMAVFMSLANLFVLLPLYFKLVSFQINLSTLKMVLYGVLPFNLIKGAVVGLATGIIYGRMVPWLQSRLRTAKH